MIDFRIQCSWFSNFKRKQLRRALGADGEVAIIALWGYARQSKSSGYLTGMTADDIETAVDWRGEPGLLIETLVRVRLLDERNGTYSIHDWAIHNPWAVGAERRSINGKRNAEARWNPQNRKPVKNKNKMPVACESQCSVSDPISNTIDRSINVDETFEELDFGEVPDTQPQSVAEQPNIDATPAPHSETISVPSTVPIVPTVPEPRAPLRVLGVEIPFDQEAMAVMKGELIADGALTPKAIEKILTTEPTESGLIPHKKKWRPGASRFIVYEEPTSASGLVGCRIGDPIVVPMSKIKRLRRAVKITEEQSHTLSMRYLAKTYVNMRSDGDRTQKYRWQKTEVLSSPENSTGTIQANQTRSHAVPDFRETEKYLAEQRAARDQTTRPSSDAMRQAMKAVCG